MKMSTALKTALLGTGSLDSVLSGFFIYIFKGPVPATADEPLDTGASHTQLAVISKDGAAVGAGSVLTFATAASGAISKTAAETWEGPIAAVGVGAGGTPPVTHVPTFLRLCQGTTDNGRGTAGGSDYRIQLTCGSSGNSYEIYIPDMVDDGAGGNTQGISVFDIRIVDTLPA